MPFRVITIPFDEARETFHEEPLNAFCLNKKVVGWQAQFFLANGKAYWTVFLEYEPILEASPEPSTLSHAQKLLYKRLREWRKEQAERQGVPVYVIATNKMLEEIARECPDSVEKLKTINGMGKKKIERYGRELIDLIKSFNSGE